MKRIAFGISFVFWSVVFAFDLATAVLFLLFLVTK